MSKTLIRSPLGIAVADVMVMLEYIPFAFHMYLLRGTYRSMEEQVNILITWNIYHLHAFCAVLLQLGLISSVPCQLFTHPSHCLYLVHVSPCCLEIHHDQVPHSGRNPLHKTKMFCALGAWIWCVIKLLACSKSEKFMLLQKERIKQWSEEFL